MKRLLDDPGARDELEVYPGVHHGFAFPRRRAFDKPAAEKHWQRRIELCARNLETSRS